MKTIKRTGIYNGTMERVSVVFDHLDLSDNLPIPKQLNDQTCINLRLVNINQPDGILQATYKFRY